MNKINTINDVREFTATQFKEGLIFHPDTDFSDYINLESNIPVYDEAEAEFKNRLLDECFRVCEELSVDYYELAMKIYIENTWLSKYYSIN